MQLQANLWLGALSGSKNSVHKSKNSALHYDGDEGFMYQISGRKTWKLFHRFDGHNLYPRWWERILSKHPKHGFKHEPAPWARNKSDPLPETSDVKNGRSRMQDLVEVFSSVHPHAPNLTRYPAFSRAKPMDCDIGPGDTLYVPSYTWHDVNSTHTQDEQLNTAVNFWTACQSDHAARMGNALYDHLRLRAWHEEHGEHIPFAADTLEKFPPLKELEPQSSGQEGAEMAPLGGKSDL
jgi:hypothetical protein